MLHLPRIPALLEGNTFFQFVQRVFSINQISRRFILVNRRVLFLVFGRHRRFLSIRRDVFGLFLDFFQHIPLLVQDIPRLFLDFVSRVTRQPIIPTNKQRARVYVFYEKPIFF